jgi:hypothetical protein
MDETTQRILCTDCNTPFNSKRALVKHCKTAKVHVQKQFPCPECGKLYTDIGSVARHVKNKVCLKKSPSSSNLLLHVSVKHMIEDDVEDRSPKRYRGEGSAEAEHASFVEETTPTSTATDGSVTPASTNGSSQFPDDTLDSMCQHPLLTDMSSHSLGATVTEVDRFSNTASSAASFMVRTESLWGSSYESVYTQPTSDNESITRFSETTNAESSNTLITLPDATPAHSTVTEPQETADATCLSDAMTHLSIDIDTMPTSCETADLEPAIPVNKRSRFSIAENASSGRSRCSVTSLGSIGSLFLNRSIRSSMSSSALSFKSVGWRSFHSFDMPAPMLEDIDEELGRSRTQGHFWKRYDPRRLRQRMLQQGFWKQVQNNDVAGVTTSLAGGEVDVNLVNDQFWNQIRHKDMAGVTTSLAGGEVDVNLANDVGCTPLRYAALQGYADIVMLFLAYDGVDLDFHDGYGTTALSWAASAGQVEIVKQLLDSGKVDKYLKGDVGSAAFAFASQNNHPEVAGLILAKLDKDEPTRCSANIAVTDCFIGSSVLRDEEKLATSRHTTPCSDNIRYSLNSDTPGSKTKVLMTEYRPSRPGEQITLREGGWI